MPRLSSEEVGASTPCKQTAPVVGDVNDSRPRSTSGVTVAPDSYGDSPSFHGPLSRVTVDVHARPRVTGRRTPDRLRTSMSTTTAGTSWTHTVVVVMRRSRTTALRITQSGRQMNVTGSP